MNIISAKYIRNLEGNISCISAITENQRITIPLNPNNTDYQEILKQVADGDITIAEAD
jgi:hypothetical protein